MRKIDDILLDNNLKILQMNYDGFLANYFDSIDHKWLSVIFSWGGGWEHLSVSTPNKTPSWDQMCRLKDVFFEEEETCIEYHPKKSEYVNNHPHCLHIWKPIDIEIPTPPAEFVGIKDLGELL